MLFGMQLAGMPGMLGCVKMMAVGKMRMMRGLLGIVGAMMFRGLAVMHRRFLVMAGGVFVMLGSRDRMIHGGFLCDRTDVMSATSGLSRSRCRNATIR
jgi:hypothetical protein